MIIHVSRWENSFRSCGYLFFELGNMFRKRKVLEYVPEVWYEYKLASLVSVRCGRCSCFPIGSTGRGVVTALLDEQVISHRTPCRQLHVDTRIVAAFVWFPAAINTLRYLKLNEYKNHLNFKCLLVNLKAKNYPFD